MSPWVHALSALLLHAGALASVGAGQESGEASTVPGPVSGAVLDQALKPVSEATVSGEDEARDVRVGPRRAGSALTNDSGEYSLAIPIEIERFRLKAAKPFHVSMSTYTSDLGTRIDFLLPRAAAIHGGVFEF